MYSAYLNGNMFFSTASTQDSTSLTTAKLELTAGTAGAFTFTIPPCNDSYGSFHKLIDFVDVYRDDDLIFSGRVYSIQETFDTQLKISCEGLLALLNDSIFRPVLFDGQVRNLVRQILANHNSQVEASKQIQEGRLLIPDSECYRAYQTYETSISRLQDLVQSYGGWMRVRKENGVLYFDWYEANIDGTTQRIDFGENLIDVTQSEDADGIITVLIPLGHADDNNVRVNITSVNEGLDYLEADQEYIDKYGYVVGSHIWDDINYPNILKTKALQYLDACVTPRLYINLTAVDLADAGYDVDAFTPGQKIKVTSAPHGIDGEWFDCVTQNLDLLNPANNKLSLGSEKIGYIKAARSQSAEIQSSIERIASTYTPRSELQIAIDTATSLITGNSGGHVVLHDSDGDGEPDELLIMDTPDIDTAVKVWRFNNAGLGYSSTGYDGTYGLAMTMDGQIVAGKIVGDNGSFGWLNADYLRTGIIQGQQGSTWWNLNTGELHIEGEFDVDKSKVFTVEPTVPYYVGDLWVTGYAPTSAVVGYAIAGRAIAGNEAQGTTGIGAIKACMHARLDGTFHAEDWQLITDTIDASAITEIHAMISSVQFEINQQEAEISSKADATVIDGLDARVTHAEETVSGYDALITQATSYAEQAYSEVSEKSKTFYEEPTTPYYVGDTWATGTEEYAAVAGIAVAGYAQANWGKEIWICTNAKSTGSFDRSDWMPATKYVDGSQLYVVRQEVRNAEVSIDAANARIDLKADATTVTDLATRVRSAEINIDGANALIEIQARETMTLDDRVTSAEGYIGVNGSNITSKVSQTDYNGTTIASLINQSASSVVIQAQHIELTGANIADRINSAATSVTIAATHINLTGQNIADRVNSAASSVKISATHLDLEGQVSITALDSSTRNKINSSVSSTVSCYYRSTTHTTPSAPSGTPGTSATTDNAWEYVMPRPKRGCYFYTCERYTKEDGTVTYSTVRELANASYTSLWCSSSDATYIDGGKIYANSVTANSLKADETFSQHITANNLDITGGSISIQIDRYYDVSYLELIYNDSYKSYFGLLWAGFRSGSYWTYWGTEYDNVNRVPTNQYIGFQYGSSNYASWLNYKSLLFQYGSSRTAGIDANNSAWSGTLAYADYVWAKRGVQDDSDRRLKKDIKYLDTNKASKFVYNLKPVQFEFKDTPDWIHHGFITQDIDPYVYDDWGLVTENPDGYQSLAYKEIIADLVATVQQLNDRIKVLEERGDG